MFQPNCRGSTNLGNARQHAIYRDTGGGPGKGVMAELAAVQEQGILDVTTWLTCRWPSTWKAVVSEATLTDRVMDHTNSCHQTGDTCFVERLPWSTNDHDIWREHSPVVAALHVTAPTLTRGDVGDPRVPLVNSYEWYHALRDNGVEVEFYAYPVDTHFPKDIVRTTDVYRRWVGWMNRHLK